MPIPLLTIHPTHARIPLAEAGWLLQKKYGERNMDELILLPEEAVYLIRKGKVAGKSPAGRPLSLARIITTYARLDRFHQRLLAYTHLRDQGYIVKSGAKYGLDYRIYPPGTTPGRTHSAWLARVVGEQEMISMQTLAGWIRLAHSVRKKLWLIMHTEADSVIYTLDWEETYRAKNTPKK